MSLENVAYVLGYAYYLSGAPRLAFINWIGPSDKRDSEFDLRPVHWLVGCPLVPLEGVSDSICAQS